MWLPVLGPYQKILSHLSEPCVEIYWFIWIVSQKVFTPVTLQEEWDLCVLDNDLLLCLVFLRYVIILSLKVIQEPPFLLTKSIIYPMYTAEIKFTPWAFHLPLNDANGEIYAFWIEEVPMNRIIVFITINLT